MTLAQLSWEHDPSCSGCPGCDPLYARMLGSTPEELGRMLRERDRGLKGPGSGRVLRVAAAGGHAGGACTCASGRPDGREAQIDTILSAPGGGYFDPAALRALSDGELAELTADAIMLTHPPDPYRLRGAEHAQVAGDVLHPPDPYRLTAAVDRRDDLDVYLDPPNPYEAALGGAR